jgi:oxygen-dependent protoporphyrinogen oxidase
MAVDPEVVVIGGGISGLAVAHALQKRGRRVVVIDSSAPGGLVRSRTVAGFTLELGANTLVYTDLMADLIRDVGLEHAVRFPALDPYRQYVCNSAGSINEVPRSPPKFLVSPLFSAGEKVRILRGLNRTFTPANLPFDATVAEFFERLLGPAPAAKVIAPVLRGIFGGNVDELIASAVFPKLFNHLHGGGTLFAYGQAQKVLKRKIFCLAGGNESLCSEIRRQLGNAVRTGRVMSITPSAQMFQATLDDGSTVRAPAVVVALAGRAVAPLCRGFAPDLAAAAERLRAAPIVAIHLAAPRTAELPREGFGVLFSPRKNSALLGIMFNSLVFPHVAPGDKHLLTVCLGGVGHDDVLAERDDVLAAMAQEAVRSALNVEPEQVLSIERWEHAIPQYDIAQRHLFENYAVTMERFPGLYFAGADIGGVGVPNRIERAHEVAALVTRSLEAPLKDRVLPPLTLPKEVDRADQQAG